jgi:hypothetical protein
MADWKKLNAARVREGILASDDSYGFNGAFRLMIGAEKVKVIAGEAEGWQHVSVSLADRPHVTPRWPVMCQVKDLFWEPEDVVVQFHPRASEYVNHHPGCLHLWRCIDREFPTPPTYMIGPKI